MFGILCYDSINEVGHSLFLNFRLALQNHLNAHLKTVTNVADLDSITTLIIVDEHHIPCVGVWKNDSFISEINRRGIQVIVFNFEKIFSSSFPWNVDHQNKLQQIEKLTQIVTDVNDATILKKKVINKQLLSKDTVLVEPKANKRNEVLFIGQINSFYPTREKILRDISSVCNINILKTDRKLTYSEYLNIVNDYKFILNPLGTGDFINLRFYEALKLGCIVIQQYVDDMVPWYDELTLPNVLKFKNIDDFKQLNLDVEVGDSAELHLENYFEKINLKSLVCSL